MPLCLAYLGLQQARIGVCFRFILDLSATLAAAPKRGWPLGSRISLPLQGLVDHLLGKHLTNGQDGVFNLRQFGSPGWAIVAVQAIDQALGHTFEIGTNRISGSSSDFESSHPWHLS
jgi:hypothetical protein